MNINFNAIEKQVVIDMQSELPVGILKECFFNPKDLKCNFINIFDKSIFQKKYYITEFNDLIIVKNSLYIQGNYVLLNRNEVISKKHILDERCVIKNMIVKTKSGKKIGIVRDYIFNIETGKLISIYVFPISLIKKDNRIISSEYIVKIIKNYIIIEDDFMYIDSLLENKIPINISV